MSNPTNNVDFIDQQEATYFAEASLGIAFTQFLESEVGRYLHGRAKLTYSEAAVKLLEINPYSPEGKKEYEKLRFEAATAKNLMQWCHEVIATGYESEEQLNNYRQDGDQNNA